MASKDPTFETQGMMGIFLSNHADNGGFDTITGPPKAQYGLVVNPSNASLDYHSSTQPPPPWNKGTDWRVLPNTYQVPPDGFPTMSSSGMPLQPYGSTCVLSISDRSQNKVALGAQYTFDQPFLIANGTIVSMHFTLSGVAGGSTVLPGFGLWNLGSNPNAWTYVAPTTFDGTYAIQLRSDDYLDYATLSVTYVRYSTMNPPARAMSRLVYSISGNTRVTFPFPLKEDERRGDEAPRPPVVPQASSRIELRARA